jgi:hypothetical protein
MTLCKINLLCITLILFVAGCRIEEKDELTRPGKIYLRIGIRGTGNEYLMFGGQIGIQRIRFEGRREAGEDFFFETDPKMNLQSLEFGIEPVYISNFDIPQGVYTYMKWDIDLKKIAPGELFLLYDLDSLKPGLFISGNYDYGYGEEAPNPIFFVIDDTVKLSFRSDDNARFILSENRDCVVVLSLDPKYAFSSISQDSIQKLETLGTQGHQIILISSNKNEDLYKDLLDRIIRSARAY